MIPLSCLINPALPSCLDDSLLMYCCSCCAWLSANYRVHLALIFQERSLFWTRFPRHNFTYGSMYVHLHCIPHLIKCICYLTHNTFLYSRDLSIISVILWIYWMNVYVMLWDYTVDISYKIQSFWAASQTRT